MAMRIFAQVILDAVRQISFRQLGAVNYSILIFVNEKSLDKIEILVASNQEYPKQQLKLTLLSQI